MLYEYLYGANIITFLNNTYFYGLVMSIMFYVRAFADYKSMEKNDGNFK